MKLKRLSLILVVVAALIFGFVGVFIGIVIGKQETATEQAPINEEINIGVDDLLELPENFNKVVQAYHLIQHYYLEELDEDLLLEGAIQGMLDTIEDPNSTYLDLEAMDRLQEQIESSFEGIGAEVSLVNGVVTIVAPIKDSPAEKASLRPNDQIIKIDNVSTEGMDLQEAVDLIRGEKGTEVILEIRRPGMTDTFEVTIVRDEIPLETVYAEIEMFEGKKTGIIEITSFSESTANDFVHELERLESEGIEGLVIDVRGNPGGLLEAVDGILQQFIPKEMPYLQIEDYTGAKKPFYSNLDAEKDYPITVLIDEGSASASEILAIALKELGHEVVGTTSFGKGTVQRLLPLGDGSGIKLTVQRWLSPSGKSIHEIGVDPTIEVNKPDYYYTYPIQVDEPLTFDQAGPHIENAQKMLVGLGFELDRDDGYFDETTEDAVKAFQQENDLDVTGVIDQSTAEVLQTKVIENIRNGVDDVQLAKALENLYE